jgi:hypothetical protein
MGIKLKTLEQTVKIKMLVLETCMGAYMILKRAVNLELISCLFITCSSFTDALSNFDYIASND